MVRRGPARGKTAAGGEAAARAELLGAIGKLGSNVNQIAKALNEGRDAPSRDDLAQMRADITLMREAVMAALGRSAEP